MLSLLSSKRSTTPTLLPPDHTQFNPFLEDLHQVFPAAPPSELRQLLITCSPESRLFLAAERLIHAQQPDPPAFATPLRPEERFRSASYQLAAFSTLRAQFPNLPKSTIAAVLAENNAHYTPAAKTLAELSRRTWRFPRLWARKKPTPSKDPELEEELHALTAHTRTELAEADEKVAVSINEAEYIELPECCCCFGNAALEHMISCGTAQHLLCRDCVSSCVKEAVFGQGSQSIDLERHGIKCFAADGESCDSVILSDALEHILDPGTRKSFERWIANESIRRSGLDTWVCPLCGYQEVLPTAPIPPVFRRRAQKLLGLLIALSLIYSFWWLILVLPIVGATTKPGSRIRSKLSTCQPQTTTNTILCRACNIPSCRLCSAAAPPFHQCARPLQHHIESAQSAAVKRVCPRCHTAFVKDSGCNKMVCVCGYAMCYLCREGLGDGSTGYEHFCGHFRASGDRNEACGKCGKCELFREVDEAEERAEAERKAIREFEDGSREDDGWGGWVKGAILEELK
ncbi:hypothetical protein EX30DRAFT_188383 [Ascodesmis nigricans]|uniref:E3 ubiquitin-protein ligase RNF216 RING finger HC subclass domain-containing protein n=1 Tax=Ascodesmis nigricans TaxID=341454 RepID=A0A4S2N0H9_9PEZI|nr:hypothetical protein EX30DRAFT_188383 [Ascodesmis nigricans]